MSHDPFDLARFILAQAPHWAQVQAELAAGRKRTHWMWFIFPQLDGLGFSEMSRHYALKSRAEAEAYLAHPVLGARLREGAALVNATSGLTTQKIFGAPDYLKFHSSMTLFAQLGRGAVFDAALAKFYGGSGDAATVKLLEA